MSAGAWIELAGLIVGAAGVFFAAQASRRSKPTSNGFVDRLEAYHLSNTVRLASIEEKLDGHLGDHIRGTWPGRN